jgi:hypothetical protein
MNLNVVKDGITPQSINMKIHSISVVSQSFSIIGFNIYILINIIFINIYTISIMAKTMVRYDGLQRRETYDEILGYLK